MLRNFPDVPYLPILSVRPGEMRALEELPNATKDRMLPVVPLRPWVGAHRLQSALARIADAYGDRPIVIGVGDREPYQQRQVFDELEQLRESEDGYGNWCAFIEEHENFIPVAQLFSPHIAREDEQLERLCALERGVVLHVPQIAFGGLPGLAQRVSAYADDGGECLFILDFGTVSADHLQTGLLAIGLIQTVRNTCPQSTIAISATSFPSSFDNMLHQPIFERRLYEALSDQQFAKFIYSDRGSARIDQPGGGGGLPYPRIDYPLLEDWRFFRHGTQSGFAGYRAQAQALTASEYWNPDIRVWGTQMIERTVNGDSSAISDPRKATAARINLHLQVQAFFDDPELAEDTEEDWED